MNSETTEQPGTDRPVWLIGPVAPGDAASFPAEGGPSFENELAASNRAAIAYSQQLLRQFIGGFAVPAPGEVLECGRSPAPQTVGPAAVERQLLNVPTQLWGRNESSWGSARFASAAELVSQLDEGGVVGVETFGEQVPFARRLREHIDRVTRGTSTIELLVLGPGAVATVDAAAGAGGAVLIDGSVDLAAGPDDAAPRSLALGATVAWHDVGTLTLEGRSRWNAVLIVRLDRRSEAIGSAEAAALRAPIASSSIVALLAEHRYRAAGPGARADLFVRAVAPGGLVFPAPPAAELDQFVLAGHRYGATAAGVRAVAMVHAGPTLSVAELDQLLATPAATDDFCALATGRGWLEYCHRGDLLT